MAAGFNLILTGEILPGHSREAVVAELARVMKMPEARTALLLAGQETVVRRGVPDADLPRYRAALMRAGAAVRVEPIGGEAPRTVPQPAERVPQPQPQPQATVGHVPSPAQGAAAGLSLAADETMNCPACGAEQPKRNLCRECGADMPRMLAAQAAGGREALESPESAQRREVRGSARAVPVEETYTPHPLGFSLDGRLGRLRYLAYGIPAYVPLVVGIGLGFLVGDAGRPGAGLMVPIALGGLVTVWLAVRAMVLRLHDLDRSGKWVLAMLIVPFIAGFSRSPVAALATASMFLIVTLLLLFLPGSRGSNAYGHPPGPNSVWVVLGAVLVVVLGIAGGTAGPEKAWMPDSTGEVDPRVEEDARS